MHYYQVEIVSINYRWAHHHPLAKYIQTGESSGFTKLFMNIVLMKNLDKRNANQHQIYVCWKAKNLPLHPEVSSSGLKNVCIL